MPVLMNFRASGLSLKGDKRKQIYPDGSRSPTYTPDTTGTTCQTRENCKKLTKESLGNFCKDGRVDIFDLSA